MILLLKLKGRKFEELREPVWDADCGEAEDRTSIGFLAANMSS